MKIELPNSNVGDAAGDAECLELLVVPLPPELNPSSAAADLEDCEPTWTDAEWQ